MDNLQKPLTEVFKAAALEVIPVQNSNAYKLLEVLADGKPHQRNNLALSTDLGETMRSALQQLRSKSYGYWLIHSVKIEGTKKTLLQLDPRHLSGDTDKDRAARRERRKELGTESHKQAVQGRKREPEALKEMTDAKKEYFKSLGNAANDSVYEKEKPTKK